MGSTRRFRFGTALVWGVLAGSAACSVNPATGKVQAFLIDEREEIELGKEADAEIRDKMRVYAESKELEALVSETGAKIAAQSERPDLPWTFRVLDNPAVNAFALPGGYIYVTRGLLAHLSSDDELAAVLGHEVGHVTARHGAVHLRKSNAARRSVGVFRVIDPNLRHVGGLAARTAGLVLLKHSRDDEYQADDLSLRYLQRTGYDTGAIPEVFGILASVSSDGSKVPAWLSTHPEPQLRRERMQDVTGKHGRDEAEPEYLATIDGLVVGPDPRDGFLVGQRFFQPRAGFRFDLPPDWAVEYDNSGVFALADDEQAFMGLAPSDYPSAEEAFNEFFAGGKISKGEEWRGKVDGFDVLTAAFAISGNGNSIAGLIGFIDYRGSVLAILAASGHGDWGAKADVVAASLASFGRIKEKAIREVEPMRVRVAKVPTPMTLAEFDKLRPSVIPLKLLGQLNHVEPGGLLAAGVSVKRVVGFNPALTE